MANQALRAATINTSFHSFYDIIEVKKTLPSRNDIGQINRTGYFFRSSDQKTTRWMISWAVDRTR
jgi:hypothetical protein